MNKIKLLSILCLTLITTAACSAKEEPEKEVKKARTTEVSQSSTTESSEPQIDESAIEMKATTPIFNELILEFLQNDLTVEYEGKVGAYEYSDEDRQNGLVGPSEYQILFNSQEGSTISIIKFEDDESFNRYIDSLTGSNGEPKLNISDQYAVNENNKMIMTVGIAIDDQEFSRYKAIFEAK